MYPGTIFHALPSVKKGVVFLAISKKPHWQELAVTFDAKGQLLFVQLFMLGMKWTLAGVYASREYRVFLKD